MNVVNPYRYAGGGGGGGAWYEIESAANANTDDASSTVSLAWQEIVLPAGNVSKLRVNIRSFTSGGNLNVGLFNSGGTLLVQGAIAVSGTGDPEVTVTTTAISAGTYKFCKIPDTNATFAVGYNNATGTAYYQSPAAVGGTLTNPLPAPDGSFTANYTFGVFVT